MRRRLLAADYVELRMKCDEPASVLFFDARINRLKLFGPAPATVRAFIGQKYVLRTPSGTTHNYTVESAVPASQWFDCKKGRVTSEEFYAKEEDGDETEYESSGPRIAGGGELRR